jgi:replicative DNA helicase
MEEVLKKIEKELALIENEKEREAQRQRIKELWEKYDGEDKVISSYELKEEIEKQKQADKEALKVYTKIPKLDFNIDGFREGNLVVISAPPKNGKTTLCQTFTNNFAKDGIKSTWFSFEVPMGEFLQKFEEVPLFYTPKQMKDKSLEWLEERIVESIAKFDTKVVFIDHLHYIVDMNKSYQNFSVQIGSTMRELKKIALKYNIIIFLVAHMKHTGFSNEHGPNVIDIRDSSFVGQESDIVMMIWREAKGDEMLDSAFLAVRAHRRTGKLCKVHLAHRKNQFIELDDNY